MAVVWGETIGPKNGRQLVVGKAFAGEVIRDTDDVDHFIAWATANNYDLLIVRGNDGVDQNAFSDDYDGFGESIRRLGKKIQLAQMPIAGVTPSYSISVDGEIVGRVLLRRKVVAVNGNGTSDAGVGVTDVTSPPLESHNGTTDTSLKGTSDAISLLQLEHGAGGSTKSGQDRVPHIIKMSQQMRRDGEKPESAAESPLKKLEDEIYLTITQTSIGGELAKIFSEEGMKRAMEKSAPEMVYREWAKRVLRLRYVQAREIIQKQFPVAPGTKDERALLQYLLDTREIIRSHLAENGIWEDLYGDATRFWGMENGETKMLPERKSGDNIRNRDAILSLFREQGQQLAHEVCVDIIREMTGDRMATAIHGDLQPDEQKSLLDGVPEKVSQMLRLLWSDPGLGAYFLGLLFSSFQKRRDNGELWKDLVEKSISTLFPLFRVEDNPETLDYETIHVFSSGDLNDAINVLQDTEQIDTLEDKAILNQVISDWREQMKKALHGVDGIAQLEEQDFRMTLLAVLSIVKKRLDGKEIQEIMRMADQALHSIDTNLSLYG